MGAIKFFSDDLDVRGKKILLRLDLNVPIIDGNIRDTTRIDLILPILKTLIKKKAKIIIISHLGRPIGKKDQNLSLIPVYKFLKKKISSSMYFYTGEINKDTKEKFSYLNDGEIILLENIRFNKGEQSDGDEFAETLSSLGNVYINEAFSCSHRKEASMQIGKYVKEKYAGPLFKKEIESINYILENKLRPTSCIIGGSKISSKIKVIKNLIKKVDNIIIVGAMANNFLDYEKIKIGKSLIEKNVNPIIKQIFQLADKNKCKIFIPNDYQVSESPNGSARYADKNTIGKDDMILDIGKKTLKTINKLIDESKTLMWNGPAGYFENKEFAYGTFEIAKKISDNTKNDNLISIVGGGDTISAVNNIKEKLSFSHLSTAGGAFLELLEGKDLPGLKVLK